MYLYFHSRKSIALNNSVKAYIKEETIIIWNILKNLIILDVKVDEEKDGLYAQLSQICLKYYQNYYVIILHLKNWITLLF